MIENELEDFRDESNFEGAQWFASDEQVQHSITFCVGNGHVDLRGGEKSPRDIKPSTIDAVVKRRVSHRVRSIQRLGMGSHHGLHLLDATTIGQPVQCQRVAGGSSVGGRLLGIGGDNATDVTCGQEEWGGVGSFVDEIDGQVALEVREPWIGASLSEEVEEVV